jgi:hypothetical protein
MSSTGTGTRVKSRRRNRRGVSAVHRVASLPMSATTLTVWAASTEPIPNPTLGEPEDLAGDAK